MVKFSPIIPLLGDEDNDEHNRVRVTATRRRVEDRDVDKPDFGDVRWKDLNA